MRTSTQSWFTGLALIGLGIAACAAGIYLGETDDAPGAAVLGFLLMGGAVGLGVRIIRRKS